MVFDDHRITRPFAIAAVVTRQEGVIRNCFHGFCIENIAFRPACVVTDVDPDDIVGIIHGGHRARQGPRTWNIGYV